MNSRRTTVDADHFRNSLWLLMFLIFPIYLLAFSYRTVSPRIGLHYVLDGVTFCAAFYLLGVLSLSLRRGAARITAMALACVIPIAFHWANLLFFDFFWDWLPFDAIWVIGDLRDVSTGVAQLFGSTAAIFGLVLPTILALTALRFRPTRPKVPAVALGCVLTLAVVMSAASSHERFNDGEPFMSFVRQGAAQLIERLVTTDYHEVFARRTRLLPAASGGYRYADASHGLFLQLPVGRSAPRRGRRPNVVLILMESFRAYESGTYGAAPSFTPSLDQLATESLVFPNFYANGVQTVRGEFSLLASQYDNLGGSPDYVLHPSVHLTTLPSILKEHGYHTSQIQAYDGDFQNMRPFLTRHGVDRVYDWIDMPRGEKVGWGLNDVSMFDRAIEIIGAQPQPFFAEVLTLSNHFPFDTYPTDAESPVAVGSANYVAYTHGIFYSDAALGHFMARARQQPWYANAIFVVTADHGLFLFPDQPQLTQVQRQEAAFRVPLLIHAPRYVPPGRRDLVGSQVDVAPTVLELLGIRDPNTFLGRSLLDERIPREDRFAILVQQSNWFLRAGDRYYYGATPDEAESVASDATHGYVGVLESARAGFETSADLLRATPRDARLLDAQDMQAHRQWGEEMLDVARLAIRNDWVLLDRPGR